jgi:hypothetical protein
VRLDNDSDEKKCLTLCEIIASSIDAGYNMCTQTRDVMDGISIHNDSNLP